MPSVTSQVGRARGEVGLCRGQLCRWGVPAGADREQTARREIYTYKRIVTWDFDVRWLLENAIDALNAARTQYSYQLADIEAVPGVSVGSVLVKEIQAPEGGVTRFVWDTAALKDRTPAVHQVIDSRNQVTEYRLNRGGQLLATVDPLGHTTAMEWDTQKLVVTRRVDGNGVVTDFTHDDFGNPLTETVTVTDFDDVEHVYTVTHTYVPADQPPFQRNLVASRTDRNGHTTTFGYDGRGNPLSQSIEVTDTEGETRTVAVHHTYAANGDRLTRTDPRGEVTTFRYDAHGYVDRVIDPLGNTTRTTWNVRGLPEQVTDALGQVTQLEYDTLGRLTRRLHPDEGVELFDYFDALNLQIETDPRGSVTRTTTDREGRVVLIENAETGQKVFEYDAEGNKTLESRWFDADTPRDDIAFEYDDAGRLVSRRETLGRLTTYGYDAVGNLTHERLESEIVDDGFVPRLTETDYDELNRPIEVRRQLGAEGFVITRQKLDGEGNKLLEVDPLNRTTLLNYDELNRLIRPL